MRGFPLINGALILLALGLALAPLWQLTNAQTETPTTTSEVTEHTKVPTEVSVRYAHAPTKLTISHLGQDLWSATTANGINEGIELELPLPKEGIDLHVTATWPAGTPSTALEITLEPEALPEQSHVLWGDGSVDDILTFQWHE